MSTQVFRLPDLGEGLTEAELVRWLVAVGDQIAVDQPIAEVETAKSTVEVPSPYAGTVAVLHGDEGGTLDVGAPLIEVTGAAEEERPGSGSVLIGYGTTGSTRSGRTRRPRDGTLIAPRRPTVPAPTGPVAVRSPIVRRLAQERGIDLRGVAPTGPGGIVTRADVEGAGSGTGSRTAPPSSSRAGVVRTEELSALRKAVSAKLSRSRAEIPEATVWVDVDATELWALRTALTVEGRPPSVTAMIARFVVRALADYPVLGARLSADGTAIEHLDGVHLGVAADTPRGLLVPVVRDAQNLNIGELDAAIREVVVAARSGSAPPSQVTGSTFTLNNYGSFGVDGSAAIINHPEVAILGIGRLIERPWVVEGAIVPRRITQLSLVFDHRVCDGGYAAGFLRRIVDAIEHPMRLYTEL